MRLRAGTAKLVESSRLTEGVMRKRIRAALVAALGLALVCSLYLLWGTESKCRAVKPGMDREQVSQILGPSMTVFGDLRRFGEFRWRGKALSVMVCVYYDREGRVTETCVKHYAGSVCIEDGWDWIREQLRPARRTPSPTSAH